MQDISKLKTLDDLKEFLITFFKDKKVEIYLFGSRAKGTNSPFSDVDIAFLSNKDISKKLTLLKELLEKSNFPYKVDLVQISPDKEHLCLKGKKRWL